VYSDAELDVMRRDIVAARGLGADGVVIGPLRSDGTVDGDQAARLVDLAGDMSVTFHRAFDFAPDLGQALEALLASGVRRVLTSGGAGSARAGIPVLASLVKQAGDRITVMAGGSIRDDHVRELVEATGVTEVHVRLTRLTRGLGPAMRPGVKVRKSLPEDEAAWEETDGSRIRSFVEAMRDG
jgi:copper homeostasis protein